MGLLSPFISGGSHDQDPVSRSQPSCWPPPLARLRRRRRRRSRLRPAARRRCRARRRQTDGRCSGRRSRRQDRSPLRRPAAGAGARRRKAAGRRCSGRRAAPAAGKPAAAPAAAAAAARQADAVEGARGVHEAVRGQLEVRHQVRRRRLRSRLARGDGEVIREVQEGPGRVLLSRRLRDQEAEGRRHGDEGHLLHRLGSRLAADHRRRRRQHRRPRHRARARSPTAPRPTRARAT